MTTARKLLTWIDLPSHWSILQQLQFEELILRNTTKNCFLFKHGTPIKTIVMGFSAKPADLLHIDAVQRDKVLVLRRYTGGGTVIVDHNSVFTSWILNSSAAACRPYPREMMAWSETVFKPAFDRCLTGEHQFILRENDYVINDRKIGGNAQTITKDRWVHHTSFLWDFAETNMQFLQLPKKRPEYRQSRTHGEFLQKLSPLMVDGVPALRNSILARARELFDVEIVSEEKAIEDMRNNIIENSPEVIIRTVVEQI